MIKRAIEPYVRKLAKEFSVVSIMGPRQTGKTTLAKSIFYNYEYVNLEDPNVRRAAEYDGATFLKNHPAPLVIDEAQYVPELLSHIQVIVDEMPKRKGLYVITGSHQPRLREGLAQSLAGRVGICHLLPLSLAELKNSGNALDDRDDLLYKGLMPRIYDERIDPMDLYANYVATYLERDVSQIVQLRDRRQFGLFLRLLAGRVGQMLKYDALAGDVGVSAVTIKSWVSVLEASYVAFTVPCYYRNYGKRFVKAPKLYFCDTGLVCYLLGIRGPEVVARDHALGHIFENLVMLEAFKARFAKGLPPDIYFIRDQKGREVDLVVETGRDLGLYEVKSARTYSADFAANLKAVRSYIPEVSKIGVVYSGKNLLGGEVDYLNFTEVGSVFA